MIALNRTFNLVSLVGLFCFLMLTLINNTTLVTIAQAQDKCKTAMADAEIMYGAGHFTRAIELLTLCLPDGIPEIQRIAAYRLLALSYLAEDYRDEAKETIKKIFSQNRDYKPDPVRDPKQYSDMVEEVRRELPVPFIKKISGGKKKWIWIGGGVVAIALVVKELVSPLTVKEGPLPEPPVLPRYR
jgi:hypothetical protein